MKPTLASVKKQKFDKADISRRGEQAAASNRNQFASVQLAFNYKNTII